jgi:hypothetical protein
MSLLGNYCSCLLPQDQCICCGNNDRLDTQDNFSLDDDTPLVCPVRPEDGPCEGCQ